MCEAARDEELTVVFAREFDGDMLSEGGRSAADVDRHVEHTPLDHADQLGLGMLAQLEVEAAHDAVRRAGFVVLDEVHDADGLFEPPPGEALEEVPAPVAEDDRFEDDDPFDLGFQDIHS